MNQMQKGSGEDTSYRNPFSAIGVEPRMARALERHGQLIPYLEQYRKLVSRFFHPDRAGKEAEKIFVEMSTTIDKLIEDPFYREEGFTQTVNEAKATAFWQKTQGQNLKLEEQIAELRARNAKLIKEYEGRMRDVESRADTTVKSITAQMANLEKRTMQEVKEAREDMHKASKRANSMHWRHERHMQKEEGIHTYRLLLYRPAYGIETTLSMQLITLDTPAFGDAFSKEGIQPPLARIEDTKSPRHEIALLERVQRQANTAAQEGKFIPLTGIAAKGTLSLHQDTYQFLGAFTTYRIIGTFSWKDTLRWMHEQKKDIGAFAAQFHASAGYAPSTAKEKEKTFAQYLSPVILPGTLLLCRASTFAEHNGKIKPREHFQLFLPYSVKT